MSNAQLGVVLRHIRRLATARKDLELPDRQLLERFATQQDEAAFGALLKRHGPMVLGVCQSVLHNLHDAEDAFQAAFLVLARKANSIHRREAVSSWLHRVAYHLAVDAQANAARRKVLERRAVTMPTADPVLDLSLRELRGVLNEELQQLPDEYRAPVVLCCLEEKSVEEAARLLGWTKWTVKGRLQRGRERLRARLRRRGLELSAGLFATVLSTSVTSAKVPATLVASTVKAALWLAAGKEPVAGVISAKVAALVKGATTTMCYSKVKIATVLLLAMGVAATAFGVVRHQASAADQPAAEQNQAAKPKDKGDGVAPVARAKPEAEETINVHGRVLDPDGKPFAGAKLYVASRTSKGIQMAERATSGEDGHFKFMVAKSLLNPASQVMAVAKGYGCAWRMLGSEELKLRLVKDVPISGRILDPEGRPVAGAKVTVVGMSAAKGNELERFLIESQFGHVDSGLMSHALWVGSLPGRATTLITGADGRFKLAGVGSERVVGLRLEGPGIASAGIAVIARPGEKAGSTYGASFDYLAVASRPIRGVVRDKATGKPLRGVSISLNLSGWQGRNRWAKAITDKEGRYELVGLDKLPDYPLGAKPRDGLFFQRSVSLKDTPGLDALNGDFDLVQGEVTVRGKVMDKATGKPIAKARVTYHPLYPNANVNKLAGFWHPRSETTTGPDGTYVLSVLAGPGVISVASPQTDLYLPAHTSVKERREFFKAPLALDGYDDPVPAVGGNAIGLPIHRDSYNAMVLLEPGEKDESLVKDVALEAARTLKGRVVGPDGQPITGVTVTGLFQRSFDTLKGAEFTVRGVNPKGTRHLGFVHKEKKLGFFLKELRGDVPEPVVVKLEPCGTASGRIVDGDGQPVAGLRISLSAWLGGAQATTDKEGRFRFEGLVPGMKYALIPGTGFFILAEVTVESGKNKDMGDVKNRTP